MLQDSSNKKLLLLYVVLVILVIVIPYSSYQTGNTYFNKSFSFFNKREKAESHYVKMNLKVDSLDSICADRIAKIKLYEAILNESILKTIDNNPKNRFKK